ncbi:MAG: hypothetical protein SFX72_22325 [Isosphaeraceae bacterium]|nr:hypothetical protein [Isosphaeraceae bacterium]
MFRRVIEFIPGLTGGAVGGVLGILLFEWIVSQGLYGLVIPGALVGLGCGLASPVASRIRGVLNGALALFVGVLAEWRNFPFKADPGLGFFVSHLGDLKPMTLFMISMGGFLGFWWGRESIFLERRLTPKN